MICEECGAPTVTAEAVIDGTARYEDTLGGHLDRHTLIVEEAERIAERRNKEIAS